MANARETALKTLYQIEYDKAYSNLALKQQLAAARLNDNDRGLATALVYGVVQRKLTLEYIISYFSKIKIKKVSKYILIILKLGIYQILYMDKIPESAAVNESVKLARRYGHSSSAGFVNGILRNVIRSKGNIPAPSDDKEAVSVEYSFPLWLVQRWIGEFGRDFACELMQSLNENPETCVRVNTLRTSRDEILELIPNSSKGKYSSDSVICRGLDVGRSAEYKNGLITAQDEAAMLASIVLNPTSGETVIDMCAAPGGKSTHMAQLMKNKGKIFSFDIHEHKIALISENAKRLGIDIITAEKADASVYCKKFEEIADKILVDVPCSGLGIIRRKPDIKWNRQPEDDLSELQYKILNNAAAYLKRGGELVYSTCTLEKTENELIIERFLKEHDGFSAVDIRELLPAEICRETAEKGFITLYPNIDKTDGFFIAKLKKV